AFVTGTYLHLSRAFLADAPAWLQGSEFDAVITELRAMCMGEALDNRAARDVAANIASTHVNTAQIGGSPAQVSKGAPSRARDDGFPQVLWTTPCRELEVA
ncbi:MAG TPA: hypothetical protein PLZ79_13285, partial [Burkholderiales bacterium]|nr:hypothetical protein [Burkholderiales bacterium]